MDKYEHLDIISFSQKLETLINKRHKRNNVILRLTKTNAE